MSSSSWKQQGDNDLNKTASKQRDKKSHSPPSHGIREFFFRSGTHQTSDVSIDPIFLGKIANTEEFLFSAGRVSGNGVKNYEHVAIFRHYEF